MYKSNLAQLASRTCTFVRQLRLFSGGLKGFIDPYKGAGFSVPKIGLVIERVGDRLSVQDRASGSIIECRQRKGLDGHTIVAGDMVHFQTVANAECENIVVGLQDRKNLIFRSDPRQPRKVKYLASNIDQLLIVVAVQPPVSLLSIDRLLAAGEAHNMKCYIIVNKYDIEESPAYYKSLLFYEKLGYPLLRSCVDLSEYVDDSVEGGDTADYSPSSAANHDAFVSIGMKEVTGVLPGKTSMLIGQSGEHMS